MRTIRSFGFVCFGLMALVALPAAANAQSVPAPVVTVQVTAPQATTNGILGAVLPGSGDTGVKYVWVVDQGTPIDDQLTVRGCITSQTGTWSKAVVGYYPSTNLSGQIPSSALTIPPGIEFAPGDACKDSVIKLQTPGTLAVGTYIKTIKLSVDAASNVPTGLRVPYTEPSLRQIQLIVTVMAPQQVTSCYLTDSEGELLSGCDDNSITASASNLGRFAIVVNKKNTQVATNPGQFYYNLIWRNNGADRAVRVRFTRSGVTPVGRQAIHYYVTNRPNTPITQAEFDMANGLGTPEGSDDVIATAVPVRSGASLIATYHLEWATLGTAAAAGIGTSCEAANQWMSVGATVYDALGTRVGVCTASAAGYRK
jgi:hypothetical protein